MGKPIGQRRRGSTLMVALTLGLTTIASGMGIPSPATAGSGSGSADRGRRSFSPEDRYAMAGGCYAVRSPDGYVKRAVEGFEVSAKTLSDAEPFHFQATALGRYLLFGADETFLAASEGVPAQVVYGVSRSDPGADLGGLTSESTDRMADSVARSSVNRRGGRGATVEAASQPSELSDWTIEPAGRGRFKLHLEATDQALVAGDGGLSLGPLRRGTRFSFELTRSCARFPEIEVNVKGRPLRSTTAFEEVRGYLDAHLHMMAFEFLGGRARCGRPWHPYGVEYSLVDCPDHRPGGHGAILEAALSGGDPVTGHNTDGWPTFEGWPRYDSLTHEQVYYRWLERAWRGGLRLFVNLLVDNNQLCKLYPFKRNSCNEMEGVRLQWRRIHELQAYIDAQHGGPGEGWFRIVTNPFQARRVISEGKLAVVLGIEVSVPLDCGLKLDRARCDEREIEKGLDEVYEMGVRQMELVNKFDNALSGVAGDPGIRGPIVNQGNLLETGRYWRMETCNEHDHGHDRLQMNFHDESGAPDEFSGRDSMVGGVLALAGASGVVPVYPEGPHCNVLALSDLGRTMIEGIVRRGMIFDPDHMSARAQVQALDLVESLGHPGVVSSHGWSNDHIYKRIYKLGGVVTPYAGSSEAFVGHWRRHRRWADDRFFFGFGYGADTNGFGTQGPPRGPDIKNPVSYPFRGLGGVSVARQRSGSRTYDINADGVAHYGLYPDWIEDLRRQAGPEIAADMARGAEAYLQMWERSIGISPDACRADVADLSDGRIARLRSGMSPVQVLRLLGQPSSREGLSFTHCASGGRRLTLTFSRSANLTAWSVL